MRKHVRACVDVSASVHVHVCTLGKPEIYVQHLPQLFSVLLETVAHWGWSSPIWLDWPATKTLEILLSPALQHWDIGPCHHAQLGVQILKTEIRPSCFYVYFSDSHIHIPWRSFIWPSSSKTLSAFDALDHCFASWNAPPSTHISPTPSALCLSQTDSSCPCSAYHLVQFY